MGPRPDLDAVAERAASAARLHAHPVAEVRALRRGAPGDLQLSIDKSGFDVARFPVVGRSALGRGLGPQFKRADGRAVAAVEVHGDGVARVGQQIAEVRGVGRRVVAAHAHLVGHGVAEIADGDGRRVLQAGRIRPPGERDRIVSRLGGQFERRRSDRHGVERRPDQMARRFPVERVTQVRDLELPYLALLRGVEGERGFVLSAGQCVARVLIGPDARALLAPAEQEHAARNPPRSGRAQPRGLHDRLAVPRGVARHANLDRRRQRADQRDASARRCDGAVGVGRADDDQL